MDSFVFQCFKIKDALRQLILKLFEQEFKFWISIKSKGKETLGEQISTINLTKLNKVSQYLWVECQISVTNTENG